MIKKVFGFFMIVICDTREQWPLDFPEGVIVERGTLKVADYSIKGLETEIAIERKSLSDLLGSITSGRERFEKELRQLRAYRFAALVVESDWPTIMFGAWPCPSTVHPNVVIGSLCAFAVRYGVVPVLAGDHATAGELVYRLLHNFARIIEKDYKAVSAAS